jgi:drug/metabolite transporter (DMT)-like permease
VTGYVLVAVAAVGWGMWPLVLAHAPMPPELQSTVLMLVVTLASLPIIGRDRVAVRASLRDWLGIAFLGLADSGNVALFFAAYQRTTVAVAVMTHYLTPIFVALAAPVLLRERPGPRTSVAVLVSSLGLVLLLEPWRQGISRGDLIGAALGAGSAVFYASNVIVNKRLVRVFSGAEVMCFHGLVGVPLLWAFVPRGAIRAVPASSLAIVGAAAVLLGAVCGLMFVWGLRRIHASHASVLTLLEPLVAVIVAIVFMGQRTSGPSIVGGLLILVGAAVVVMQPTAAGGR